MPGEHEAGTATEAPRGADLVPTNQRYVLYQLAAGIQQRDRDVRYPSESTDKCRTAPTPSKLAERLP